MDEITEQLKLKYELEHDISRIHSKKLLEQKDMNRQKLNISRVESDKKSDYEKLLAKIEIDKKKRESALEKKKVELAQKYMENDKLSFFAIFYGI